MIVAPEAPTLEVAGNSLPLTRVTASGRIAPTVASLRLAQEFTNGETLADVTYHCPLHPDWAVRAVTMRCGEREIHTVVFANERARETFEQARDAGHTAVLADEVASDELRLQLANVPAGAGVEVTTEIVAWPMIQSNRGSLSIPLISGPKYGGDEAQQPYFDADDPATKHTGCRLDLELAVSNPSIDVGTIQDSAVRGQIEPVGQVTITFDAEPHALWHQDDAGSYLVVGVPAIRPQTEAVKWGSTALLIDRSGSMGGQGLTVAAQMSRDIAAQIGDGLRFVYSFDDRCEPIWAAEGGARRRGRGGLSAVDAISHLSARGGTELGAALKRVHKDLKGKVSDLVLVTDALVAEHTCTELVNSVRHLTEDGIAVHVILVGAAPGRFIGDCISHASGGLYLEQTGSRYDERELADSVSRFLVGGATLEGINIDGSQHSCTHPVRGRPVMVAVEAKDRPTNVTVRFEGQPGTPIPVSDLPEARFVWARERVMGTVRAAWSRGETVDMHEDEIERLGVDHQILTPFTSMVGFDPSKAHDRSGVQDVVAQASLPTGMDAAAFFGINQGGALGLASRAAPGREMMSASRRFVADAAPMMDGPLDRGWLRRMLPGDREGAAGPPSGRRSKRDRSTRPTASGPEIAAEAATILATILEAIEAGAEPIGPWVRDHSLPAIVLAATSLQAVGCRDLSAQLARRARRAPPAGTAAITRRADELQALAETIARRLGS